MYIYTKTYTSLFRTLTSSVSKAERRTCEDALSLTVGSRTAGSNSIADSQKPLVLTATLWYLSE